MAERPVVMVVFGTRPEAIKLAPVLRALAAEPALETVICTTGQHRQMLDQILHTFRIVPHVDLRIMTEGQTLAEIASRVLTGLDRLLTARRVDLLLVQGDTTSALASALAAFYRRVPVGHVEAGLRTGNLQSPWPEEANRVLISRLAALHFAPTAAAAEHLFAEGADPRRVFVTGNTVVDALEQLLADLGRDPPRITGLPPQVLDQPLVLITGHRRENFGGGFEAICRAIAALAVEHPAVQFVYPVHRNPNVRGPVQALLASQELSNVHLIDPLPYREFIELFRRCTLVLSDSGGVQEEAPSLGKPVLLMRDTTERPEALACGCVKLVGTDVERIVFEAGRLLRDAGARQAMVASSNPFGDGRAVERIVAVCREFLLGPRP